MLTCAVCGTPCSAEQKFCAECGSALGASSSPREERKVVTILFTDLAGFTRRSEELDPEDVRALLSPYYVRLRREIERFGGTVEKFIGDAVMAVFGAPVAHEDDPERAVRAALAIRSSIQELNEEEGLELVIRTGVNTGPALVALDARPSEGEGMVSGDVVNTAARLETAAPVGAILVGEMTYRATQQAIEYREAAPVQAKGKAQAVLVWEAIGSRARFGVDVDERPTGTLVGRAREVVLLTDALERTRADETAQLVTLVGVPGIGKSRLVAELFTVVEASVHLFLWRQGRSLPYGEQQSFWALAEIVKAEAGILESDGVGAAQERLARVVRATVPDERESAWVERHLQPLVGVTAAVDAPVDRSQEAFAAWRRFLEGLAEQRPLVLVFEDLHWADDGLLDFIDHLAEWAGPVPMLIVATARPELLERRPDWGGGKRNASTVSISPLSDHEMAEFLGGLLEQALLPAEVQAEILARSAGNPLYTQEYVRMLQDRGFLEHGAGGWRLTTTKDLPLPENVQGMIAARIDALSAREKQVLQDASVLGKVFWPLALAALGTGEERSALDGVLHALGRKEFIRRDRRSALADDQQYAFLHVLVRDVAYSQIPRAQRAAKHRAAADWLEALSPERAQDTAEMLVHHVRAAVELAAATGSEARDLQPRLVGALIAASERAEALNAWAAARDRAVEALELTDEHDPRAARLALRIAWSSFSLGSFDETPATRARDLSLASGDIEFAATAEVLRSQMLWFAGRGDEAFAATEAAVELVADRPPSPAKAWALAVQARRDTIRGDPAAGRALGVEALAMAETVGRLDLAAHALNTIGLARSTSGDPGGLDDLVRSIEVATEANAVIDIVGGMNNLANQLWAFGRLPESAAALRRHEETCERFGLRAFLVWNQAEEAYYSYFCGDYGEMIERAERFVAEHGDQSHHQFAPQRNVAAHGYAALGRLTEALEASDEGLHGARATGAAELTAYALLVRAHVLVVAGRSTEAMAQIDELLTEPAYLKFFHWLAPLPLILVELGREEEFLRGVAALRAQNPWREAAIAAAEGRLLEAAAMWDEIGSRFVAAWARLLAAERGDASEIDRAAAVFDGLQAVPYAQRVERLLALPA